MQIENPGAGPESPVRRIVPEPVTVQRDRTTRRPPASRRPSAATTLAGRLLGLLRGDKYMVNAYPPDWRDPTSGSSPTQQVLTPRPGTEPEAEER